MGMTAMQELRDEDRGVFEFVTASGAVYRLTQLEVDGELTKTVLRMPARYETLPTFRSDPLRVDEAELELLHIEALRVMEDGSIWIMMPPELWDGLPDDYVGTRREPTTIQSIIRLS